MDETTASRLINEAKARQNVAPGLESYFWGAYIHGVRRAWHGEAYDSENARHTALMETPEEEIFDDARLMQVRGYKAGLAGELPAVLAERLKNGWCK